MAALSVNATPVLSRIVSIGTDDLTPRKDSAKTPEHVEKENVSIPQRSLAFTAIPQPVCIHAFPFFLHVNF